MMSRPVVWRAGILLIGIIGLIAMTIVPYGGNITALFHMDVRLADEGNVPEGFTVLDVPAYDGAQYELIARKFYRLFDVSQWGDIALEVPGPYAYQRILLPFLARILSLKFDPLLPFAFLFIEIACLLGTFILIFRETKRSLPSFALALSPAATLGLHFILAEPLSLLLTTWLLVRYLRKKRIDAIALLLLSLLMLTREVNVLLLPLFGLFALMNRRWIDVPKLIIPALAFIAWHGVIYLIFDQIPFLWSVEKSDIPLATPFRLLTGTYGYTTYTFSSIALLTLIVLPVFISEIIMFLRTRVVNELILGTMLFLAVMIAMPDHIWGSITSIGRVITPVYPFLILRLAQRPYAWATTVIAAILALGIVTGIGLATIVHPVIS